MLLGISNFLLALYNITGGNVTNGTLPAGDYMIECAGAKGGDTNKSSSLIEIVFSDKLGGDISKTAFIDNFNSVKFGGAGSKGWIKIKVNYPSNFSAIAGMKGNNSINATGGFPDGGNSYGNVPNIGPGSGGGSSSFYINETFALVCGAGSGAYSKADGAPAGGNEYNYVNNGNNNFIKITDHSKSTSTMKGGDGSIRVSAKRAYAGGGGGYKGGNGGNDDSNNAASGESYVNKSLVEDFRIYDGIENPNNGDGYVRIFKLDICIINSTNCSTYLNHGFYYDKNCKCYSCEKNCDECLQTNFGVICTRCSNKNHKPKEGKCSVKQTSSFHSFLNLRHKYYHKD